MKRKPVSESGSDQETEALSRWVVAERRLEDGEGQGERDEGHQAPSS
ncbi:MAG: hypothetical protein ABIG03_03200 [Candidatus Eisenbacteria bacterium]